MNLGSDYLKFDFDKAELRAGDRELLSRIAGILATSQDYTVSVNGHTDDVGTPEYNQKLSLRRAQAVRDYLVQAGLPPGILSVTGHGKSRPLVPRRVRRGPREEPPRGARHRQHADPLRQARREEAVFAAVTSRLGR